MNVLTRQFYRIAGLSKNAKLFLLTISVVSLGNGIFLLFLNLFILTRGNDEAFLGLLMSTMSFAALVLGLPMGILVDRIGQKKAMLLGALFSTLSTLLLALSPTDWPLIVAAVFYGAGNALFLAAGPAFMAENATEDERPTLFSLHSSLSLLMGFLGSLIGGPLPALFGRLLQVHPESATAYRATLLSAEGIIALALFPLLMIQEKPRHRTAQDKERLSLQKFPIRKDILALLIPEFIIALGASLLIPYLNIFFKQKFRVPDSLLGLIFAVSQLLTGLAAFLSPILAERFGKIRTVVLTQLASLPFLLTLGFVPVLPVAIAAFWLRTMLMNMAAPLYTAFAMERVRREERGTVGAMIGVAYSIGQSIGPGISGLVQRSFGFSPLFLTTGTTYLFASLLTFVLFGRAEHCKFNPE